MKAKEAIEILTHYDTNLDAWNEEDTDAAVKLGCEALKRIQRQRQLTIPVNQPPLPGEDML